jgi:hypothetical protein
MLFFCNFNELSGIGQAPIPCTRETTSIDSLVASLRNTEPMDGYTCYFPHGDVILQFYARTVGNIIPNFTSERQFVDSLKDRSILDILGRYCIEQNDSNVQFDIPFHIIAWLRHNDIAKLPELNSPYTEGWLDEFAY